MRYNFVSRTMDQSIQTYEIRYKVFGLFLKSLNIRFKTYITFYITLSKVQQCVVSIKNFNVYAKQSIKVDPISLRRTKH